MGNLGRLPVIIKASIPLLLFFFMPCSGEMIVSGPIYASTVSVTGDVTLDTMIASSITITNLSLPGASSVIKGQVVQTVFTSTTTSYMTTSSTLTSIPGFSSTICPLSADSYFRISVSGLLESSDGRLSLERDSIDLGQGQLIWTNNAVPVGVTIVDSPGDISCHTYTVVFANYNGVSGVNFTASPVAFFMIEEILQ